MSKIGLLVRIEAKSEYADQVEALLQGALELARAEELTVTWFAFKESPTVFGVFDTFEDEEGRSAHLNGPIAAALGQIAPTMLAADPDMRTTEILAVKLP
ncbi:antibiotic biosynthesis monooxygenase [Kitasatospora sp. MAP5-34]|uniref:putative quinol monooxygenase n=1 Tax=Kitasatospora sp. MAP5-34 TaxID=3035102 RepID=UPI002473185C|nr:antibiotic biosynthesis monooxygenase [Kitasatospora sp. MAP5-34]MDH6576859.1 quinol monooxygenase YgiN [Kitasatospora sp. MAP5-34]